MADALIAGPTARLWFKRAKIPQQRPATQSRLRRRQVPVEGPVGVQGPIQRVHRTVHRVARAMATRVTVALNILFRPTPELLQRLLNRTRPAPRRTPLTQRLHRRTERSGRRGPVHLPDLAMQLDRLAAAVADLQEPVQEAQDHD